MINVVQLGSISYAEGLKLQEELVSARKEHRIPDTLLLLEHTPVITLGRNAKRAHVLASDALLAQRGVDLFECNRGGDVTFHGPGQLVGYPIFNILEMQPRLGAVDFVRRLEEVLIRTCAGFGIATHRVAGLTGVWTEVATDSTSHGPMTNGQRPAAESKIAAIGIHISRGVTSHGFALNVNTDLDWFRLIVPCGIAAKPVTSMQRELGATVDFAAVAQAAARNFGGVFGSQVLWSQGLEQAIGSASAVASARENSTQ